MKDAEPFEADEETTKRLEKALKDFAKSVRMDEDKPSPPPFCNCPHCLIMR